MWALQHLLWICDLPDTLARAQDCLRMSRHSLIIQHTLSLFHMTIKVSALEQLRDEMIHQGIVILESIMVALNIPHVKSVLNLLGFDIVSTVKGLWQSSPYQGSGRSNIQTRYLPPSHSARSHTPTEFHWCPPPELEVQSYGLHNFPPITFIDFGYLCIACFLMFQLPLMLVSQHRCAVVMSDLIVPERMPNCLKHECRKFGILHGQDRNLVASFWSLPTH